MPNQPKTPARAVRISDELWAALRDIAERTDVTVSDVVRLALEDFAARHH
jgi:predicted transcriptional regulator